MWNPPSRGRMRRIPGLYKTEHTPLKDKLIYLHFYLGNSDWYVAECNGTDTFWGFVILNGDLLNAEWGYFTLRKLDQLNVRGVEVEHEKYWMVKPASQIGKIAEAQGWQVSTSKCVFQMNRRQHV